MASAETRNRLGRILSTVGSVWIALYFIARFFDFGGTPLGDILESFGSSFFVPILLLFAGRSILRRSRRTSVEDALGSKPESQSTPPPAPRPAPSRPAPPPPVIKPAPVDPAPVDMDELAEAIGFDASEETPSLPDVEVEGPKTSAEMIADAHRRNENDD
ncbi:MAG: hypothetical protein E2O99_00910 [Acidobacteria bacterium]|nr:MAG: hypothetical protein E2O99_00910 [Acidobacteriota bacterium]